MEVRRKLRIAFLHDKIDLRVTSKKLTKASSIEINRRPIPLLDIDMKIVSKALSTRLKNLLLSLISSYIHHMLKVQNSILIYDIAEMIDILKLEGFLVAVNIEKASDSVNQCFLISGVERFGFGTRFLKWIKTQLKN